MAFLHLLNAINAYQKVPVKHIEISHPKGLTQPSNFRHFLPCMVSLYNILCGTILEAAAPTVSPVIGRPVE